MGKNKVSSQNNDKLVFVSTYNSLAIDKAWQPRMPRIGTGTVNCNPLYRLRNRIVRKKEPATFRRRRRRRRHMMELEQIRTIGKRGQ